MLKDLILKNFFVNDELVSYIPPTSLTKLKQRTEQDSFQAIAPLLSFKPVRSQVTFTSNLHACHYFGMLHSINRTEQDSNLRPPA